MKGTYRKEGVSARVATVRGGTAETTTRESGISGYSGDRFFSASAEASGELPGDLLSDARALHASVSTAASERAHLERTRVVCGVAHHRFFPEQDELHAWSETQALVHVTLLAPSGARTSILRGGPSAKAVDSAEIAGIAAALASARPRTPPDGAAALVLGEPVAAAIAAAIARRAGATSRFDLDQQSHPDFALDGEGRPIAPFAAKGHAPIDWPNVFRPSYRSPAVATLMHVELPSRGAGDPKEDPIATIEVIEVVGQPYVGDAEVTLEALCSREGDSFLGTVELSAASLSRAVATGSTRSWYPFHAGSWGRRLLIGNARFR